MKNIKQKFQFKNVLLFWYHSVLKFGCCQEYILTKTLPWDKGFGTWHSQLQYVLWFEDSFFVKKIPCPRQDFWDFTLRQDFWNLTQSAPASAAAAIIFLASPTSPLKNEIWCKTIRSIKSWRSSLVPIYNLWYHHVWSPGGFAPTLRW